MNHLCLNYVISHRKVSEIAHAWLLLSPREARALSVGIHTGQRQKALTMCI